MTIASIVRALRSRDPLFRFKILYRVGRIVLPEYRFQWPYISWWQDRAFNEFLSHFDELNGMNTDRKWILYQLLRLVVGIPGDTVECGAYTGASSYLICRMNEESQADVRTHFVFDSFEGLSQPAAEDGAHWVRGDLACDEATVARNLGMFPNVRLLKGWIPTRFHEVADRRFAFVHVDVDLYQPTRDSIEYFYSRLNDGGILVCDDYGSTACPGAAVAADQFLSDKPEKMIALQGGGGFLIKGSQTAPAVDVVPNRGAGSAAQHARR